jgi:protein disulfide-isomerase
MVKQFLSQKIFFSLSLALLATLFCTPGHAVSGSRITWMTNYEEAVNASKSSSKPLLMFFTGSDWCGWCNKLEEESLDSPEFSQAAAAKFVFLKLDFPLYSSQDPKLKKQNEQLKQKFGIRSYPTIVLFDAQQNQQMGTTGYRAGGGKQYADHLQKMVNDYNSYKRKMSALESESLTEKELKLLYDKSQELKLAGDSKSIIKRGMGSSDPIFFSLEQYRLFGEEGCINCKEAMDLRTQLFAGDPKNEKGVHYKVALIEYETYCLQKEKTYESAVDPLVAYLNQFGSSDIENAWRLQMIISQVYLDGNQMPNALRHAEASYKAAPESARGQIAQTIHSIRLHMHSSFSQVLTGI